MATKSSAPTDVELARRYLAGDSSAFDELFRRYHGRVKATCLSVMGDEATADDMVQDTFVNVLRSLDRIDETFNFGAWVQRIASNVCKDELRRRQRRAARTAKGNSDEFEDLILRVPDGDPSGHPELALESERLRNLIWEVAKKLPERQSTALAMRELQGRSYASIARFMGISESAVETLLHRARRRFREEFLLLEGPTEEEGMCAMVARSIESVGLDNIQAAQRTTIIDHVATCSWCRERLAAG